MMNYPNANILPTFQNFQQPNYSQPSWGNMPQNNGNTIKPCLKSLPVTSIDEARASLIDLDGSMYVFVNMAQGEIYTKQYNFNTGKADFITYCLKQNDLSESYVSKETFDNFVAKFEKVVKDLEKTKGAGSNGKSNANNANVQNGKGQ